MITKATREENLKKINEKLEKLDDEQLEKIAGGINPLDQPIVDFFLKQNSEQSPQVRDAQFYDRIDAVKY